MRLPRALDPWLWPLLVMALIFALSATPNLSTGLGLIDLIGRKIAHAAIFAALCWSSARALLTRASPGTAAGAAFAFSLLYAVSDEFHQSFVAGRHAAPLDVAIDGLGAAAAGLVWHRRAADRGRAGVGSAP